MQSVLFDSPGEPAEVLRSADFDLRDPGPGEVRVRMIASPVNPSDLMFVRGVYGIKPHCPQVPGFEGVGTVEASGGGLRGKIFQGKRVVVLNSAAGNWAEQAVVPTVQVIPVSDALSVEQAATFFVNPATAWIMTQEVLKVRPGEWLLQTAAGSALGHMIARLGQQCGFKTLNVVRRDAYTESLKRAGATELVVFDPARDPADKLLEQVNRIVGEHGLKYAIDPVGGETASAVTQCLGARARMLLFGTLSGEPIQFSSRHVMEQDASISGFWLSNYMAQQGLLFKLKLVRKITGLIQSGILATEIGGQYPLSDVVSAVQAAAAPGVTGKVLLKCQ